MRATVRHILIKTKPLAKQIMFELEAGADFADLAQEYSACPSADLGGELGTFEPGDTVPEFEDAIFDPSNQVEVPFGPLETEFGLHIIEITQRSGNLIKDEPQLENIDTTDTTSDVEMTTPESESKEVEPAMSNDSKPASKTSQSISQSISQSKQQELNQEVEH